MPQPGDPAPSSYAASGTNGMRPALVIGLVITVAMLVGLVAGLSVVIFKGDPAPPAEYAAQTTQPVLEPPAPASLTESPVDPQITPPAASTVGEAPPAPSVVEELRKAREATEAAAAAQAKAAQEKAAALAKASEEAAARAAAQPSEDIIEWLGRARITGVRLSDTESKVILNGKTYGVGEYVHFKLGLKVMVIQEQRVLFIDENGKKYLKRL
jgi:type IV secretory pathway VirB10-like protein